MIYILSHRFNVKIIISYHKNDEMLNDIYILSHHFNVELLFLINISLF